MMLYVQAWAPRPTAMVETDCRAAFAYLGSLVPYYHDSWVDMLYIHHCTNTSTS